MRRATVFRRIRRGFCINFYPRSPCGERPHTKPQAFPRGDFYPRSPCGERLAHHHLFRCQSAISIHALLAESDFVKPHFVDWLAISIHALLAESDLRFFLRDSRHSLFLSTLSLRRATCRAASGLASPCYFYPRSPCGERPKNSLSASGRASKFLSTLSLRRATCRACACGMPATNFYPRSPCGERPKIPANIMLHFDFYPRSPCGERRRAPGFGFC